jgi:diacylglycerol kinase (ATP)
MGTANGFARGLDLPFEPLQACRSIAQGKVRRIDTGYANGLAFAATFGTGFDAWVAQTSDGLRFLTRFSGFVRYFTAGLAALFSYKAPLVRVTAGNQVVEKRCLLVAVGTSRDYGLGASVCPQAVPDDGLLDLVVLEKTGLCKLLFNVPRMFNHRPIDGAHRFTGKKFKIEQLSPGPGLPFHVDGEVAGQMPVTITIKAKSLQLLVP